MYIFFFVLPFRFECVRVLFQPAKKNFHSSDRCTNGQRDKLLLCWFTLWFVFNVNSINFNLTQLIAVELVNTVYKVRNMDILANIISDEWGRHERTIVVSTIIKTQCKMGCKIILRPKHCVPFLGGVRIIRRLMYIHVKLPFLSQCKTRDKHLKVA